MRRLSRRHEQGNERLDTDWTPHDLRHTGLVRMLAEQLDEATEKQWRGEIERLTYIRAGVISKIDELDGAARRVEA